MRRIAFVLMIVGAAAVALGQEQAREPLLQSPGYKQPARHRRVADGGEARRPASRIRRRRPGTPNPAGGLFQFGGSGATLVRQPRPRHAVRRSGRRRWRSSARRSTARRARRSRRAFALDCTTDPNATMSRGKPLPIGPTGRLPDRSRELGGLRGARRPTRSAPRGDFPWTPLDHPLQSTAHMLFPAQWTRVHPEHERFDVGFDIPDCYLPEFPPPLYLTHAPRAGRRHARRRDHLRQLLRHVQRPR